MFLQPDLYQGYGITQGFAVVLSNFQHNKLGRPSHQRGYLRRNFIGHQDIVLVFIGQGKKPHIGIIFHEFNIGRQGFIHTQYKPPVIGHRQFYHLGPQYVGTEADLGAAILGAGCVAAGYFIEGPGERVESVWIPPVKPKAPIEAFCFISASPCERLV